MAVWLITGTTSGFGRRLVTSALARGDKVIATARSQDKLQELVEKTCSANPRWRNNIKTMQIDVLEGETQLKEKVEEAAKMWGRIDVMVNNAGVGFHGLLEEGGMALLRRNMESNLFGMMKMTTAVLPHLRANKEAGGTLVFLGSRSAWTTDSVAGSGNYGASKAAVHALAETFSVELAPFNIRVLLVAPGSFRTEGIFQQKFYADNRISAYDSIHEKARDGFAATAGVQKGDPEKAMEVVVDVVRGEGVAKGRAWPFYLVLGEDADQNVDDKCNKVLGVLKKWRDVARRVNFD